MHWIELALGSRLIGSATAVGRVRPGPPWPVGSADAAKAESIRSPSPVEKK
jgi:hypothetical protein